MLSVSLPEKSNTQNNSSRLISIRVPWDVLYDLNEKANQKGISRTEEMLIRVALHKHDVVKRDEIERIYVLENELSESNAKVIGLQNQLDNVDYMQSVEVVVDENEIKENCMLEMEMKYKERMDKMSSDLSSSEVIIVQMQVANEILQDQANTLLEIVNNVEVENVKVLPKNKVKKKKTEVIQIHTKGEARYKVDQEVTPLYLEKRNKYGNIGVIKKVYDLKNTYSYDVQFANGVKRIKEDSLRKKGLIKL